MNTNAVGAYCILIQANGAMVSTNKINLNAIAVLSNFSNDEYSLKGNYERGKYYLITCLSSLNLPEYDIKYRSRCDVQIVIITDPFL